MITRFDSYYNYKLYFIPDPPYMAKLPCNAIGEIGIFLDSKGQKTEWKFITLLHEKQMQWGLTYGNYLANTFNIFTLRWM